MRRMNSAVIASILIGAASFVSPAASASSSAELVEALLSLCLGAGAEQKLEAQGQGDVALTLKKLRSGEIGGSGGVAAKYSKSEWQGLVGGINSQLSQLQADQADKVRDCLKPYMPGIVEAILKASR